MNKAGKQILKSFEIGSIRENQAKYSKNQH